jgi:hypothetical protein
MPDKIPYWLHLAMISGCPLSAIKSLSILDVEKPCSGANYTHPAFIDTVKKNYCDKDGKCTAEDSDELIACRFYIAEVITRSEMCLMLSKLGDKCLDPCASEAAKTEYIADILRRDG